MNPKLAEEESQVSAWEEKFDSLMYECGYMGNSEERGEKGRVDIKVYVRTLLAETRRDERSKKANYKAVFEDGYKEGRRSLLEDVGTMLQHYSITAPERSRAATFTPEQFMSILDSKENERKEDVNQPTSPTEGEIKK